MTEISEFPFLAGGGNLADLVAGFDWAKTPLGPITSWPQSLKTTVSLLLRSKIAIVTLWGEDGIMIYNDAYSEFAGTRHPSLLGSKVREGWEEVADFNDNVMRVGLAGGTLAYRDQKLTLYREGRPHQTWLDLDYSPILGEAGVPVGVMAIVVETTEKVRAELWRNSERDRLRQMFEQAPGFMALLRGPQHAYEMVNPAYLKVIGHRDVMGKTVAEALDDAAQQGYVQLLDQVYDSGKAFTAFGAKYAVQTEPGGPVDDRYLDFVFQPIKEPGGETSAIFVQGYDVTDRVVAQAELDAANRDIERNKERSLTWQVSPDLLGALNSEGYFITSNPAWQTVLGWSEQEVASVSIFELLHPDDVERTRGGFELTQQGHPAIRFPNRYRCKDGSYRWISWTGVPEGGLVYCSGRDITEEVEQAEALEERTAERDMMAGVLTATDAFVHIVDLDYHWLAINPAGAAEFERVFGTFPHVGDRMLDLLEGQPEQRAAVEAVWGRALAGEEFSAVAPFGDVDGAGGYYQLKFNALRDKSGNRIGAFQFVTDVTQQTKQAQALAAAEEALRQSQKMEAVGQLTGGLAHDFNNILAGVGGSLELIKRRVAQGRIAEIDRYLAAAEGGVRRAASLTQRLLAFSRRQTLDPKPTDINRAVADMLELVRRSVGPSIDVEAVAAGGLWTTLVDVGQLENALLNLSVNARDAMPNGGKLTIETANRWLDVPAARTRNLEPGQYVSLCVSDNGSGMSPDVIERAFEPFFTTKPIGQGTGLGLSMVYGFAGQSGGTARIYSEVGNGTMICIYLPRYLGDSNSEEQHADEPEAPRADGHETILFVDDEPLIRALAVEQLQELGYNVLEAEDGKSALRILNAKGTIDLLVTDVGLPSGMNGRQLADFARVARPGLQILFITGYAENAVLNHGHLEPGMQVMTKPFTMDALAERVKRLVSG